MYKMNKQKDKFVNSLKYFIGIPKPKFAVFFKAFPKLIN